MFKKLMGLGKSPEEKLRAEYKSLMEQALAAQRGGKRPLFAQLTAQAEEVGARLDALTEKG